MAFIEFRTPQDILQKAKREYGRLKADFNIDNVFNYLGKSPGSAGRYLLSPLHQNGREPAPLWVLWIMSVNNRRVLLRYRGTYEVDRLKARIGKASGLGPGHDVLCLCCHCRAPSLIMVLICLLTPPNIG